MSITTKEGDDGLTSLRFGQRVSKTHPRLHAYGSIEELSSVIGIAHAHLESEKMRGELRHIQEHMLFICGELMFDTTGGHERELDNLPRIEGKHLDYLDVLVEDYESYGFDTKGHLFPGNTIADAYLHNARAVCRRAERRIQAVIETSKPCSRIIVSYLNRLSDVLWLQAVHCSKK